MAFRNFFNALLVCEILVVAIALVLASPTAEIASLVASNSSQSLELSPAEASLHDKRTVWNIVWSCITTIVACCWVAVHPNMLAEDATQRQAIGHRLIHMAWMIIAPELIICWAIRQWVGARNLMNQNPFKKHNEDHKDVKEKQWTMTHGLYLQMGGFMLRIRTPSSERTEILTVQRLKNLVYNGDVSLPIIDRREINDRSKSDEFSKTIAIGQTTWFLAQCLTRKAQGLVTTELELVTIAFAALNVFIYFFWWDKPLDARTTVKVSNDSDIEISESPYDKRKEIQRRVTSRKNDIPSDTLLPQVADLQTDSEKRSSTAAGFRAKIAWHFGKSLRKIVMILVLVPVMAVVQLFHRVGAMLFDSPEIRPGMKKIFTFYALATEDDEHAIILAGVGLIGAFFGGIHCIGWNYFFPSHAETVIWRISSVTISVVPGAMAFGGAAAYAIVKWPAIDDWFEFIAGIFFGVAAAGVIPYIIARILLLVEAFISLRDLPPDALLAVRWTSFLPHF